MTLKHVKFEDSAVMRSLEKLAKEKGLVSEKITKNASAVKKLNLSPSESLTSNIVTLCSGLREAGFHKHAEELEEKFFAYKQAETLYETSKEKGEDLVDEAHPKGSHKLEDVDGDEAVFETILDQHLKMIKMIDKEPTGKLASSEAIIDSVGKALGSDFLAVKRAQEAESGDSGVAGALGGAVIGSGVVYGISKLWQAVLAKMKPSLQQQVVKDIEKRLGGKLSKEMVKKVGNKIVNEAVEEAIKKRFGQKATEVAVQQAEKQIAEQAAKSVAEKGVQQAAKNVATTGSRSSGLWSRILGLVGRGGATAAGEGGAAAAVEGGAVAAGEGAAGVAAGGAAVGGATVAAAVVAAAIVGGLIGNELFKSYLAPEEIKDAGQKLIEKAKDVKSELPPQAVAATMQFESTFNKMLAAYPAIKELEATKSPNSLVNLKELDDLLWQTHKLALTIWGWAQSAADDQFLPRWISKMGELIALAKNYMDRVNTLTSLISQFLSSANRIADEKLKEERAQKSTSVGGEPSANLMKSYTDTLSEITRYLNVVKAKGQAGTLKNSDVLVKWLEKASRVVTADKIKFEAVPADARYSVADTYSNKLKSVSDKLKEFNAKYIQSTPAVGKS